MGILYYPMESSHCQLLIQVIQQVCKATRVPNIFHSKPEFWQRKTLQKASPTLKLCLFRHTGNVQQRCHHTTRALRILQHREIRDLPSRPTIAACHLSHRSKASSETPAGIMNPKPKRPINSENIKPCHGHEFHSTSDWEHDCIKGPRISSSSRNV